ncbi:MAG: TlpA family protein disulfide reductase [Deltaproteobacteria bacterium]|nr:TlpA family protein disulfide reductase [Deltaproteobacteria bacterium]
MSAIEILRSVLRGVLAAAVLGACGAPPPRAPAAPATAAPARSEPVSFAYATLDGRRATSASLRGRLTLVTLLATYDLASQAQARFVKAVALRHVPRINAFALVLEPEPNRPLVEAFVAALDLPFAVAMGDEAAIAGRAPFPGLHHVPSVVLLDREGREVWRAVGLADEQILHEALREHEGR